MLRETIGEEALRVFRDERRGRAPCACAGVARPLSALVNQRIFTDLVLQSAVEDVLVMKNGNPRPEAVPRSEVEVQTLHREGSSVALLNAHRTHAGLARVAAELALELDADVSAQVLRAPARHPSFGWQYNLGEVFIVQSEGAEDYYLYESALGTGTPSLSAPTGGRAASASLLSSTLVASDWLYVPPGWWYNARASKDSLAIVLQARTHHAWPSAPGA